MDFHDRLEAAANWLEAAQRPTDGGWGLAAGQASSIVNTAEALFVLRRARLFPKSVDRGLAFIRSNLARHLDDPERGKRVRYVAFALLAFSEFADLVDESEIRSWVQWLMKNRNRDGGWGHEARDGASQLFPTAMAMWALRSAHVSTPEVRGSEAFVLGLAREDGWRLHADLVTSPVANAFGLLALGDGHEKHPAVVTARKALLQTCHWGGRQEPVPGSIWSHSTFAWVLPQVVRFAGSPFEPVVAEGIRYINSLTHAKGWAESPGQQDVSVRSQFWATMALSAIHAAFDPAEHPLRIEATRVQASLPDSDFVKIGIHSSWATVVPAKGYRLLVWCLLLAAVTFLWGGHRVTALLPGKVDSILSIVTVLFALFLVRLRPKYVPKLANFAGVAVLSLEVIHLIFGVSLFQLLQLLQVLPGLIFRWSR